MSIWTHVAGCVRVDGISFIDPSPLELLDRLGVIRTYDDDDCFETKIPCGSEGSLRYDIWVNPSASSVAMYTVSIFGDLRDYDDLEGVKDWANEAFEGLMIRQGTIEINCENGRSLHLKYNSESNRFESGGMSL